MSTVKDGVNTGTGVSSDTVFDVAQAVEVKQVEIEDYASQWIDNLIEAMQAVEKKPEKYWVLFRDLVKNFDELHEVIIEQIVEEKYRKRVNDLLLQFLRMSKSVMIG